MQPLVYEHDDKRRQRNDKRRYGKHRRGEFLRKAKVFVKIGGKPKHDRSSHNARENGNERKFDDLAFE